MRRRDERGSMAVEMVVLIPLLFAFTLLVLAGGRYVSARADADATARDAARAASLARSSGEASAAIQQVFNNGMRSNRNCALEGLQGDFESGGTAIVRINCTVSLEDLGLVGLSGSLDVNAEGRAPIDVYRRTG